MRRWIGLPALGLMLTACGLPGGPTTHIPSPLWPATNRWVSAHIHPASAVVFVGTVNRPSAPGFHGTSLYDADASAVVTAGGREVRIPKYAELYITVSSVPPHRVIRVIYTTKNNPNIESLSLSAAADVIIALTRERLHE